MTRLVRTLLLFVFVCVTSGCYTQMRPPMGAFGAPEKGDEPFEGTRPDVDGQRFEYYRNYGRYDLYDPYDFGINRPYAAYGQWPYAGRNTLYRYSMAWDQACWISVYDRQWRWYSPAVLLPYVVYRSPVASGESPAQLLARQRPQVRRAGFEGAAPSAGAIRVNPVSTPPPPEQTTTPETSGKQTPAQQDDKKEEEDKEKKREEKRDERKKRGGMR
ncbi:MAG: hypothetical protein O3B73_08885 [bacterium]|nr:hypothetical protein [bacterium]